MQRNPTHGRCALMAAFALSLLMLCSAGCATVHSSPLANRISLEPELTENVSVIFVEATPDLGNWGKLPQIAGYFRRSAVESFYFDPDIHGDAQALASWIRHERVDRGRHVLLIGWSYGLVQALDALKCLESTDVRVDTLVSVDCFWLNYHRGEQLQPKNADRIVLIYRESSELPTGFLCPVVHRIETCNHLAVPGHPKTMDVLFRETIRLREISHNPGPSEIPAVPHKDEISFPGLTLSVR